MSKPWENPFVIALSAAAVVAVVGYIVKKGAKEAAAAAGGVVSGNNALTRGTPYQGAGVAGTVGAATNAASGGVLQGIGESLGSWVWDTFGDDYDPNKPVKYVRDPDTLQQGVKSTNYLWGPLGSVELRP